MPVSSPLNGIPVPTDSDADNVPASLDAIADVLDSRLVGRATDEADRNAVYGSAPAGTLVVSSTSPRMLWVKTGAGSTSWAALASYQTATSGIFTAASGWSLTSAFGARSGPLAWVSMRLTYTGASAIATTASGNLPDTTVGTFSGGWTPSGGDAHGVFVRAGTADGSVSVDTGGTCRLRTMHTGTNIENGDYVDFSLTYLAN
jgi:hypothetical protein